MKLLNTIREWLGRRLIRKAALTTRRKAVHNFGTAKSIALVYKEKGESYFILVKQYVQYLKAEHGIREVMALCYIDQRKGVPHYHVHRLKFDYFTSAQVGFNMVPNCDTVRNFAIKDFDILIDLEKEPCLPLQFVVAQSKAAFKVGYYNESYKALYDMMLKSGANSTFDDYVQQLNHYLNLINTVHARA